MTEEIIDLCSIPLRDRTGRKTKYQYKVWEATLPKDKARYAFILSKSWYRRKAAGKISSNENPYQAIISSRHRYEIEMEAVFHYDIEDADDVSSNDEMDIVVEVNNFVSVPTKLNSIVNIKCANGFFVLCDFQHDAITNQFFSRVPCGVVNKKMSLFDIYSEIRMFSLSSSFDKQVKNPRKENILSWLSFARKVLNGVVEESIEETQIIDIEEDMEIDLESV